MTNLKKELTIHLFPLILLFIFTTLFKRWFFWQISFMWLGGVVGTLLPDLDHLIYSYIIRPQELTSKRTISLIEQKQYGSALDLLLRTRHERAMPVFHTALFQIIFTIFTFFIISSNSSLFGRGIVLGLLLHLLVDQYQDFSENNNLNSWFVNFSHLNHNQSSVYLFVSTLIICILALFF